MSAGLVTSGEIGIVMAFAPGAAGGRHDQGRDAIRDAVLRRGLKASTLRTVLTQAGISREDFLRAYDET